GGEARDPFALVGWIDRCKRVLAGEVPDDLQRDRLGNAHDGELAVDLAGPLAGAPNPSAAEGDDRVAIGMEEAVALQIVVELLHARPETRRLDHHVDRAAFRIRRRELQPAVEIEEESGLARQAKVIPGEADRGVLLIELPRISQGPRRQE